MYRARHGATDQCAGAGVQHASVIAASRYNIAAPRGISRSLPWGAVVVRINDDTGESSISTGYFASWTFDYNVIYKVDAEIIYLLNSVHLNGYQKMQHWKN